MNNNQKTGFNSSKDYISWLRGMKKISKLNPEERENINLPIKEPKNQFKLNNNNILMENKGHTDTRKKKNEELITPKPDLNIVNNRNIDKEVNIIIKRNYIERANLELNDDPSILMKTDLSNHKENNAEMEKKSEEIMKISPEIVKKSERENREKTSKMKKIELNKEDLSTSLPQTSLESQELGQQKNMIKYKCDEKVIKNDFSIRPIHLVLSKEGLSIIIPKCKIDLKLLNSKEPLYIRHGNKKKSQTQKMKELVLGKSLYFIQTDGGPKKIKHIKKSKNQKLKKPQMSLIPQKTAIISGNGSGRNLRSST